METALMVMFALSVSVTSVSPDDHRIPPTADGVGRRLPLVAKY